MVRKIPMGDFFFLSRVISFLPFLFLLYGPQVDPFLYSIFLSAYRMTRGHKEVSTSQVRRMRDTPRETPTASSLVVAMFVEELRLYNQIPARISLETSEGAATSTFWEAYNAIYFIREQFVTGLHLLVSSLVK